MVPEKIISERPAASSPEKKPESGQEILGNKTELVSPRPEKKTEPIASTEKIAAISGIAPAAPLSNYQKQRAAEIDNILADGLDEVFLKMDAGQQKEFRQKGEETVLKINSLLDRASVKMNKVIILIKQWLQLIPGINRFFLEQEAKIKADKIIRLKDRF